MTSSDRACGEIAAVDVTAPVGAAVVCPAPLDTWPGSTSNTILPPDDRDIIVIEDRCPAAASEESLARRQQRKEYRRLFAQLRRRQA